MPNRRVRVHHVVLLGSLLLSALFMQGCLGIVWLVAAGIDSTRTSDIEFQSFENSWGGGPQERQRLESIKSIAVMPFVGDPVMAERWATVFREMTNLRVVSLSDAAQYGGSAHRQIELVQRMSASAEFQADCVLMGNVIGQKPQKSFAGLKESSSRRLYLQLVSAEGISIWKTELPFTIVKGTKKLNEEMVTHALLSHVRVHANELGLAELRATTKLATSPSLPDTSDDQIARPLPRFERP